MDSANKVFGIIAFFVVFLVVALMSVHFVGFHYQTGNGTHHGVVTAIDTSGIFFKTTKVYFKTSKDSTQEDVYCIATDKVKDLKPFLESGESLNIEYESYVSNGIAVCDAGVSDVITSFKKK